MHCILAGSMLFDKLTTETMEKVFLSMSPLEVLPKTVIIQQGDEEASKFYVLESGTCEVLLANDEGTKVVHQYKAGSYFGELALLYDQPRAATVQSTSKCKLWVMERSVYNAIYHQEVKEIREAKLKLVQSMPIFKLLSETLQGTLCDVLKLQEAPANKPLFYKGDEGDLFYVIKEGTVEITVGEKVPLQAIPLQCTCDAALQLCMATCISISMQSQASLPASLVYATCGETIA
jgi:CRP-like cAMP-binding protein